MFVIFNNIARKINNKTLFKIVNIDYKNYRMYTKI